MGTLKKIGLLALFLFLATALLSWQSGTYPQYCNQIEANKENCPGYNLLPFFFFKLTDFFHDYEATFTVLSTIAIAVFTFTLWRSTDNLWTSTTDGLKLARDEFNASHRPRVAIRRVWAQLATKQEINIEFTIVNTGDAPITSWIWNAQVFLLDKIGEVHNILTYDSQTQKSQVSPLECPTSAPIGQNA